ncbi:retrovirus-related pol polyprotein from transposon RE1 [Citrus sinensis]|uniref:Retrovirus-related pol polyprotein from transposon RE1 n=1 Tax=Citrus sinensis TaxID=2711 RepID=A0ACB8KFM0_CITSI|nr:retrovirus-related pol polyprotein from transposon RE1 [Citrus sinensis]
MANSSTATSNQSIMNLNQPSQTSFTFVATVKLDRSNFLLWRKQVLITSIRGNCLEKFISEPQIIPEQYLSNATTDGSGENVENPAYVNWRALDQTLLGWLLSTISEGILNSILSYDTSFDVWKAIEKQFGVQSEVKIMQLRYEMNILRKDSMNIEEYCAKMKLLANKLACAGDIITEKDMLMRILNGLGSGYLDLASIITANKMSYDDAYALLLTHEARLEQSQGTKTMLNANYSSMNVNHSYMRGNFRRGTFGNGNYGCSGNRSFNGGRGVFHNSYPRGSPTGVANFGGYGRGQTVQFLRPSVRPNYPLSAFHPSANTPSDESPPICQICHKQGHTTDECWHIYDDSPTPLPKHFGKGRSFRSKAAYMANFDPFTNYAAPTVEDNYAAPFYSGFNPMYHSSYPSAEFNAPEAYLTNYEGPADDGWYLDSGATHHLTNNMANMNVREEFKGSDQLVIGDGHGLSITHVGDACFTYKGSNVAYKSTHILLKDMLLVPDITKNLLSISKLTTDNNLSIEFTGDVCYVKDSLTRQVLLKGLAEKGLYKLILKPSESIPSSFMCQTSHIQPLSMLSACSLGPHVLNNTQNNNLSSVSLCNASDNKVYSQNSSCNGLNNKALLLHRRFGHHNSQTLMHLLKNNASINLSSNSIKQALNQICEACQMGKSHKLHFPITEIKTTKALELIHTDLWGPSPISSRDGYTYYISFVDDFSRYTWIYPLKLKSEAFEVFKLFKLQVENQLSTTIKNLQSDWGGEYRAFTHFLNQCGIIFRHSGPYTHHQNGVVERKHRHTIELGLPLLAQAKLPFKFWWDAFHIAVYHINRLPSTALKLITLYEKIFNHKPDYSMLKCFGCTCYPYLRDYNKHKFDYHSSKCIFIGYSPSHKGYKCMHPSGRIYIVRHVVFEESTFPYSIDSVFHSTESTPHSSQSFTPQQVYYLSTLLVSVTDNSYNPHSTSSISNSSQSSDNSSHTDNQNLPLQQHISISEPPTEPSIELPTEPNTPIPQPVPYPSSSVQPNIHSMTTRSKAGIFKPKLYTAALIHKEPDSVYEAMQNPKWLAALMQNGTWSLVPRIADQKVVGNKWVYRVKYNTDGSVAKYKARLVAKGFQQIMGVNCFETFSPVIKPATVRVILSLAVMNQWKIRQVDVNNAFLNGELTEEVFMDQPEGFVDVEKPEYVCKLHKSLYGLKQAPRACTMFALKDLGALSYFLGIEVLSIVGGMQYLVLTRPEIAFSVHKLSQYVSAPSLQHLMACKRVLRYLKATQNYGLKFVKEGDMKLTCFTDADWAGDLDDRKSVGAYCVYLGHNLISWSS